MGKHKIEDMYIISALHEIPILTKRIEKQKEDLRKYSSSISNWTPEFGSAEAQRKEVEALLQSTLDLIDRQRWLKRCIAFTNSVSKLEIDGLTYSIAELLAIKSEARSTSYGDRRGTPATDPSRDQTCSVYDCLCDANGKALLAQYNKNANNEKDGSTVVLYYDEAKKKARYDKWYDFVTKITSELEIFNARTKLLDPDDFELKPKEKE